MIRSSVVIASKPACDTGTSSRMHVRTGGPSCLCGMSRHPREVFREVRQDCQQQSTHGRGNFAPRILLCLYTVNIASATTRQPPHCSSRVSNFSFPDWRGYLLAFFALVWVANQYMSIYNRLRLDIKHEQVEITAGEQIVEKQKAA